MERLELRVMQSSIATNDEDLIVEGLVNKTESWSHTLGVRKKFKEKICRGAFDKAIQNANRIDFLCEHDSSKLLSTTENNSLQLWEDEEGLKMRAIICPTTYGRDLYELMRSKLVNHMSFGFRVLSDKWKKLSNGTFERIVEELELLEVSAVRNPAYPQSAIAARGIELVEDVEIPDDIDSEERSYEEMEKELFEEFRSLVSTLTEEVRSLKDTVETLKAEKVEEAATENLEQTEEKSEEVVEAEQTDSEKVEVETEAAEEATEEKSEEAEEKVEEVETKTEEGRSFDLSAYRAMIKERR